jgi:hypothetical protein
MANGGSPRRNLRLGTDTVSLGSPTPGTQVVEGSGNEGRPSGLGLEVFPTVPDPEHWFRRRAFLYVVVDAAERLR